MKSKSVLKRQIFKIQQLRCKSNSKTEQLVLNGFWRSGTTFIQEFLQSVYHTEFIFEPLNEVVDETRLLMDSLNFPKGKNNRRIYMPELDLNDNTISKIWFNKIIHLELSDSWTKLMYNYKKIHTYNPSKNIIKFVNAHFFLTEIVKKGIPVIHINRDLISTINSFKRTKWSVFFQDLNFDNHLPSVFYELYGQKFKEIMNEVSLQNNYLFKVALFKLVTDYWVKENVKDLYFIDYDDFIKKPFKYLQDISTLTGWELKEVNFQKNLKKPSSTAQNYSKINDGIIKKSSLVLSESEIIFLKQLEISFNKLTWKK